MKFWVAFIAEYQNAAQILYKSCCSFDILPKKILTLYQR